MHYSVMGADGPTVVLLHGIPGSGAEWEAVAERLAGDHRVVVADLIGFGESDRSDDLEALHAEGQAEALERSLTEAGVERAVFAGHDFGGPVALTLMRRRRDLFSGLALISTNAFTDTPIPMPIRAITWPLIGVAAERILFSAPSLRMMLKQGASVPLPAERHLGDQAQRRAIHRIFAASLRELAARYAPVEEALGAVDLPALVVWGDRDPFFSVDQGRRTAGAMGAARFELYEGCGHFAPEERPAALADDLRRLVREAGSETAVA